jgi:hypothetical protein
MIQAYSPSTYPRRPVKVGRTLEKWILYLVVLAIAGVSLYWFIVGKGKTFDVSLNSIKGTVEYRASEKEGWSTVNSVPMKIPVSTEIRTLADSEAAFSSSDGSKMALGSYSRIVLSGNQGEVSWVQTDGSTHHQTTKNNDRKGYKVAISDGVVEAQGTAFEVKIKDTDTAVLVLNDQVKITYKDKSVEQAKAGQEIMINPVGKKVQDINDQELKEDWTLNQIKSDQKNLLAIDNGVLAKAGLSTESASSGNENDNSLGNENGQETVAVSASNNNSNANTNSNTNITTETVPNQGKSDISLEVKQNDKGVLLSWSGAPGDFESWKVLKGNNADVAYPNDSYRTLPKENNSYLWEMTGDGNTYNFRICAYKNDGGCVAYSNAPSISPSATGASSTETTVQENTTENTNTAASTSSTATSTVSNDNSGVTSRKLCENSGGHWTKASRACKCPKGETFVSSVKRCKKK